MGKFNVDVKTKIDDLYRLNFQKGFSPFVG